MTDTSCLSVIMPVCNTEQRTFDSINSILEQTFLDFELIILSYGPKGKFQKLAKKVKDKRIKFLDSCKNYYQAVNRGLEFSSGKYVCMADDRYISIRHRFEKQILFMERNSEFGMAGSGYMKYGSNQDIYLETDYEKIKVQLLKHNCLIYQSVIMRRDWLKKHDLKFRTDVSNAIDYDFIIRASKIFPITNIKEALFEIDEDNVEKQGMFFHNIQNGEVLFDPLRYIGVNPSIEEKRLYLQLLREQLIEFSKKRSLFRLIEKIIEKNKESEFYKEDELVRFLHAHLSRQPFCRNGTASFNREDHESEMPSLFFPVKKERKYSIEVLTLLSGDHKHFKAWNDSICKLEFDQPVSLRILDNSGNKDFGRKLVRHKGLWGKKFSEVIITSYLEPYRPIDPDFYLESGRHQHVAKLYSQLFAQVKSDVAFTFEEDIIPEKDAFRKLYSFFDPDQVGVIGAAYSSPQDKNVVCAAFGKRRWEKPVPWNSVCGQKVMLDYIGGGFTLWNLSRLITREIETEWGRRLGWDAVLCDKISSTGLKVFLDGNVICEHRNRFIK